MFGRNFTYDSQPVLDYHHELLQKREQERLEQQSLLAKGSQSIMAFLPAVLPSLKFLRQPMYRISLANFLAQLFIVED